MFDKENVPSSHSHELDADAIVKDVKERPRTMNGVPLKVSTNNVVIHPDISTPKKDLFDSGSTIETKSTPLLKSALRRPTSSNLSNDDLPPISDPGYLLTPRPMKSVARMGSAIDRCQDTPELPRGWTDQHDRAICYLDVRGYELDDAVKKLRNYFPELLGVLNADMVDKRLRQLDQDLSVNFFADAISHIEADVKTATPPLTPATPNTEISTNSGSSGKTSKFVSFAGLRERASIGQPKAKPRATRSFMQPNKRLSNGKLLKVD